MAQWDHPHVGRVRLVRPAPARLWDVDDDWPSRRPSSDASLSWRWTKIAARMREVLALLDTGDRVTALWASSGLVRDSAGSLYFLEFWEVEPSLRGTSLAAFVLGLVARRAREAGCVGVLLHSLPETAVVYDRVRIPRRVVPEKPPIGDLISFVIEGQTFEKLLQAADALEARDD